MVNAHGPESRGARIMVDAALNPPGSAVTVILNSDEAAGAQRSGDGTAYVEVGDFPPSEVLVLTNHTKREEGGLRGA